MVDRRWEMGVVREREGERERGPDQAGANEDEDEGILEIRKAKFEKRKRILNDSASLR